MEVAQVLVDAGCRIPGDQAVVGVVQEPAPFDVLKLLNRVVFAQPTPETHMTTPEAYDLLVQPGGPPVRLHGMLVALQSADQPFRQPAAVVCVVERPDGDLPGAAFLAQEAPEPIEGAAAHLGPLGAQALGLDVLYGRLQVRLEVELPMRLEREAKHMAGHRNVQLVGDGGAGATANDPGPEPGEQHHVFGRPGTGWLRAGRIGR